MSATLTLSRLDVAYGARTLVRGLDLVVAPGAVTALVGANGSGKSSLMRVIVGELPVTAGSVRLAPADASIGWLPQATPDPAESLLASRGAGRAWPRPTSRCTTPRKRWRGDGRAPTTSTPPPWSAGSRSGARTSRTGCRRSPARSASTSTRTGRSGTLSGGQAARAALASVLLSRYDVLLLDEPTNNLDAHGLELMAEFVTGHEGPVLVASHDRAFLDRVATDVVELDLAQQRIGHYSGGWSEYVAARELERRQAREAFEEYAGTRDRLVTQGRQRAEWAAKGLPQRRDRRRAGQAHPGEARPRADRQAGKAARIEAVRRPARGGGAAAQGVGAALRHRPPAPASADVVWTLDRVDGESRRLRPRAGRPDRRPRRPAGARRRQRDRQDHAAGRDARRPAGLAGRVSPRGPASGSA